nr:PREDICTED: transmembrane and TPR repeat-containing protein 2-like [Bemisia tabaci]XP_018903017.1 PREDICTED: transmembrane and TPR repeat-containing protein 2-like [Bemisia tabaci]
MDKVLVTCCLLGLLLYYNTLNAGFVYDDSRAILSNPDVLPSTPLLNVWTNDFWGTPLSSRSSHGSYRPLCMMAFRLDYSFCGLKPACYHITNVALYLLSIVLVAQLARALLPPGPAKLAVLFFTVHPIHTEAVAGIVGRADLLSSIFYLFSLLSYLKHIKYRNRTARHGDLYCAHNSKQRARVASKRNGKSHCNGTLIYSNANNHVDETSKRNGKSHSTAVTSAYVNGGSHISDVTQVSKRKGHYNGVTFSNGTNHIGEISKRNGKVHSDGATQTYSNGSDVTQTSKNHCNRTVLLHGASIHCNGDALHEHSPKEYSNGDVKPKTYWNGSLHSQSLGNGTSGDTELRGLKNGCHQVNGNGTPNGLICGSMHNGSAYGDFKSFCGRNGFCNGLNGFSRKSKQFSVRLKVLEFLVKLSVSFSSCGIRKSVGSVLGRLTGAEFQERRDHVCQWGSLALTVLFASAAMISKETGVTVLAVCAVLDLIHSRRTLSFKDPTMNRSLMVMGCSGILLLLFRGYMMGSTAPTFATADNPTAKSASLFVRTATFLYLPVFNLSLLLLPLQLSFDWSMDAVPRIHSLLDRRNLFSLLFYLALYKLAHNSYRGILLEQDRKCPPPDRKCAYSVTRVECKTCKHLRTHHNMRELCACASRKSTKCRCSRKLLRRPLPLAVDRGRLLGHHQTVLVCLALTALPFLPATNFFFYVGFVVAERVLFTPSVGFCFLMALGCGLLERRSNCRIVRGLAYIVLIVFSARTVHRNRDWLDEESLYRASLRINPPKAYGNLGSVLSSQGRLDEAEHALKMALSFRPNMADVHYNLGLLYQSRHQFDDAIRSYELAIQFRSSLALAHLNLGQLLGSLGRCEEAEMVLTRCANISGEGLKDLHTHELTRISALLHLGRLHADRGRYQDAVDVYKRAVKEMPPYYQPQILYNLLGEALSRLGQVEAAEYWYQAALQAKPDHVPAHLTYGKLLARNKTRIPEAELWFQKAQKLAPKDPSVHQHFGQFLAERGRFLEAAYHLVKAAELAPTEYDLVVSAATALRQAGHGQKAEQMYRRAVELKPMESGSHSNLGAMLHLNGRYEEAIKSYSEALRLDPRDSTTLHNLEKLEKLMSRPRVKT